MAGSVKSLLGLGTKVFRNTFFRTNIIQGTRFLYTDSSLGLDGYTLSRNQLGRQFNNVEDTFRSKMNEICQNQTSMIFTEDLKAILHLAKKTPEDLDLIIQMVEKFNKQNQDLKFGNFIFGPVIMRTMYYLDEPKHAFDMFTNPTYDKMFDQQITYQILMCLLYKHGEYEQMKTIFDMVSEKNVNMNPYPRNIVILVMAACFKLNTAESLKYGTDLWSKLASRGVNPSRRSATFLASLAIQQQSPNIAMEIMSSIKETRYIDCRCLKIIACVELDRFNDVLMIIRSSIQEDQTDGRKVVYFNDVIQQIEDAVDAKQPTEKDDILKLIETLRIHNHVTTQTLRNHLEQPIDHRPFRNQQQGGWSTLNRSSGMRTPLQNPGLRDML